MGLLFLAAGCQAADSSQYPVRDGVLDLSGWDREQVPLLALDGDWAFHWDRWVGPEEFSRDGGPAPDGYVSVPGYWTLYGEPAYPPVGRATYRLMVENVPAGENLAIRLPEVYTEYALWADGELLLAHGVFANEPPRYLRPVVLTIPGNSGSMELVLQIQNERHAHGGIGQSLVLGEAGTLYGRRAQALVGEIVLVTVCVAAALYHGALYLFRREEKKLLYFALFSLLVGFRGLLSNETYLLELFPAITFAAGSRVLTILIPLIIVTSLLHFRATFPREMPAGPCRILLASSVGYLVVVLGMPSFWYSLLFTPYLLVVGASSLLIAGVVVRAFLHGDRTAAVFLAGTLPVAWAAFNDILFYLQRGGSGYRLTWGLSVFVLVQSLLLAREFTGLYREKDQLAESLLAKDLAFMQAQIKPHFIYNALNVIHHAIRESPEKARNLLLDFSDYLRGCFIFDDTGALRTLGREIDTVRAYLSLEKARFGERLQVVYKLHASAYHMVPMLVLQPLVENAVRHGLMQKPGGGTVTVSTWTRKGTLHIRVTDDGVGMPEEAMEGWRSARIPGEGVGLRNVDRRLQARHGAGLQIRSEPGRGTTVDMRIPVEPE